MIYLSYFHQLFYVEELKLQNYTRGKYSIEETELEQLEFTQVQTLGAVETSLPHFLEHDTP